MGGPFQPPIRGPGLGRGFRWIELSGFCFNHVAQINCGTNSDPAACRAELSKAYQEDGFKTPSSIRNRPSPPERVCQPA